MSPPLTSRRRGFTLGQLIVLLAILALLLGFLLAAVSRVRRAAGRSVSMNNLKQMTLATINFADQNNSKTRPHTFGLQIGNLTTQFGIHLLRDSAAVDQIWHHET